MMKLQFFIRMMSERNTMVIQAYPRDTVRSIHERIQAVTGIPVFEQRLIYGGKQLQSEQTLADCCIQNDANLQLVGRMRSSEHAKAWQVINDMVSLILRLCRGEVEHDEDEAFITIRALMASYLIMTPEVDKDSAAAYFQIFICSSAPALLVKLYMSPHRGRGIAYRSIRLFLNWCRTALSKPLHSQCPHVVLEFCKLLRSVGSDDPLYRFCRRTLVFQLQIAGVSYGSESGQGLVLIQEISPFVCELANSLMMDLDLSMKSTSNMGPSPSDFRDFAAFLLALRTGITEHRAFTAPFSSNDEKHHKNLLPAEEIGYLRLIFIELLKKMHQCLQKVEDFLVDKGGGDGDPYFPFAWSLYLYILRELHHISKFYEGAEGELRSVLRQQKSAVCLLIMQYAESIDDHQWILEHKDVTDFVSRRHLAVMMFPKVKADYEELHHMLIDRSQLLAESFEYIARAEAKSLRGGLFMEFKNEEATGPGVLREWFLLVCQELFNPQRTIFQACPNDRRRFFPNPASKGHPLHLDYFIFAGRVIGLALMHKIQVGIVFDRVFFLQLAGKCISLEDIRDADPYMYNSCKQILEMDADFIDSDALGLTFVREVEELGSRKAIELCPGGKSIVVNSKNRDKYVDLLIQDLFVTSVSDQVSHFARGFGDILCNSRLQQFFFQSLELEDFDWMLHGSENTISVEDWKAHTKYNGYKESDPQISWFWETVGAMSAEQKTVLLLFWTSIKYLPIEGFRGLASRLYIYKTPEPDNRLPSSSTCFYRLCLPSYPSLAIMQDRLRVITQQHIGCSFGTW